VPRSLEVQVLEPPALIRNPSGLTNPSFFGHNRDVAQTCFLTASPISCCRHQGRPRLLRRPGHWPLRGGIGPPGKPNQDELPRPGIGPPVVVQRRCRPRRRGHLTSGTCNGILAVGNHRPRNPDARISRLADPRGRRLAQLACSWDPHLDVLLARLRDGMPPYFSFAASRIEDLNDPIREFRFNDPDYTVCRS